MFTEPMLKIVLKYLSAQTHCKQYAFKKNESELFPLVTQQVFIPLLDCMMFVSSCLGNRAHQLLEWCLLPLHSLQWMSVCALTLESDQLHTFLPWSMTTAWSKTSEARRFYSLDESSFFDIDTVCFFSFLALHGLFIVLQYFGTMPKRGRCAWSLAEIRDLLSSAEYSRTERNLSSAWIYFNIVVLSEKQKKLIFIGVWCEKWQQWRYE